MADYEQKYKRIMEKQQIANKKYIEANREMINAKTRDYYHTKLVNNPSYKARKQAYAKQYYLKKKLEKSQQTLGENL